MPSRRGAGPSGHGAAPGGGSGPRGSSGRPELPPPLLRFAELVNAGEYWESHEVLEEAWRATGSEFYHGLILYASAFVHARRGTPHGIVAQLEKAEEALAAYPPDYLGVDVRALLDHVRDTRRRVEARRSGREADRGTEWGPVVEWPRLELDAARVRGDEQELDRRA